MAGDVRDIAEEVRDMQTKLQCLDLLEHEKNGSVPFEIFNHKLLTD